ncbi:hypothetical protein DO659_22175 [Salmonella enterica subsp. enterica serovar Minnesota]|nr:hypothetical protein [Salmonella enterica subsp. enterica serovar Minnesota]ECI4645821.1 hypothetical protein [Salmonella enterica subsp. salamae]
MRTEFVYCRGVSPKSYTARTVIIDEKQHLDQIVATLGMKEITQGALIRKLYTYSAEKPV